MFAVCWNSTPCLKKAGAAVHQLLSHIYRPGWVLEPLTLPKTNTVPENWWWKLLNYFPFEAYFQVLCLLVSGRCLAQLAQLIEANSFVHGVLLIKGPPTKTCEIPWSSWPIWLERLPTNKLNGVDRLWRKYSYATQLPSLKLTVRQNRSSQKEFQNQPFIYRGYTSFREG